MGMSIAERRASLRAKLAAEAAEAAAFKPLCSPAPACGGSTVAVVIRPVHNEEERAAILLKKEAEREARLNREALALWERDERPRRVAAERRREAEDASRRRRIDIERHPIAPPYRGRDD